MLPNQMGLDEAKEVRPADARCLSLPFPAEPEGGFTVTCPKLPPVVTYGESMGEAQANAREAIELCLEVTDGQPIPPPDRHLTSPIDQIVPVIAER
jgi:antitoxin HicB